jgi:chromosome segregation protein
MLPDRLDEQVQTMRKRLSRLKNVNPDAPREYAEAAERCDFLETQSADLESAIADLHDVISKLDTLMESELQETFDAVAEEFVHYFELLFGGGAAKLTMIDPNNVTESGIEILARPPGKRPQSLALLSGGERTLAACALIFAILRVSPTPFCVLDEVDAALDEANVDRFRSALGELSQGTQFIVITHNRRTLEGTNAIYGVTMGNDGVSRVISLKLEGERIVRGEQQENTGDDETDSVDASGQIAEIDEIVQL